MDFYRNFFFKNTSSSRLAITRALFFSYLFLYFLISDYPDWVRLQSTTFRSQPYFDFLHLNQLPEQFTFITFAICLVSLLCAAIGLFTRYAILTSLLLTSYFFAAQFHADEHVHHQANLIIFAQIILLFSHCSDAFSFDNCIFERKNKNERQSISIEEKTNLGVYNWPLALVQSLWALMFFSAAVTKIRISGLDWIDENTVRLMVWWAQTNDPLPHWILQIQMALTQFSSENIHALRFSVLLLELCAPLALFIKILRIPIVSMLFLMQVIILLLFGINFSMQFGIYLFFIPWEKLKYHHTSK